MIEDCCFALDILIKKRSIFYSAMVEAEREMMLNLTTQHKLGILQRLIT